jgi:hypothetical protein
MTPLCLPLRFGNNALTQAHERLMKAIQQSEDPQTYVREGPPPGPDPEVNRQASNQSLSRGIGLAALAGLCTTTGVAASNYVYQQPTYTTYSLKQAQAKGESHEGMWFIHKLFCYLLAIPLGVSGLKIALGSMDQLGNAFIQRKKFEQALRAQTRVAARYLHLLPETDKLGERRAAWLASAITRQAQAASRKMESFASELTPTNGLSSPFEAAFQQLKEPETLLALTQYIAACWMKEQSGNQPVKHSDMLVKQLALLLTCQNPTMTLDWVDDSSESHAPQHRVRLNPLVNLTLETAEQRIRERLTALEQQQGQIAKLSESIDALIVYQYQSTELGDKLSLPVQKAQDTREALTSQLAQEQDALASQLAQWENALASQPLPIDPLLQANRAEQLAMATALAQVEFQPEAFQPLKALPESIPLYASAVNSHRNQGGPVS